MYREDAEKLHTEWGTKPCDHPDIIEELATDGSNTDHWLCTQCGRSVVFAEWRKTHKGLSRPPTDPRDWETQTAALGGWLRGRCPCKESTIWIPGQIARTDDAISVGKITAGDTITFLVPVNFRQLIWPAGHPLFAFVSRRL
jgi:hypothetical protein